MTIDPLAAANLAFKVGDRVRLKATPSPGGLFGRVIDLRGPLGPKGAQVYGVRIRREPLAPGRKAKRSYVEVLADQIELVPPAG